MKKAKILYFDNYDSFASLIKNRLVRVGADVAIYKSDADAKKIVQLEKPDMIVLGPGPNSPNEAGNYLDVIDTFKYHIPIFGICLGHQAIVTYFGGKIVKLPHEEVLHGKTDMVYFNGNPIFEGIMDENGIKRAPFARYNSLGIMHKGLPSNLEAIALNDRGQVMAVRHVNYDIIGVQFHPESHLSSIRNQGEKLLENVVKMYAK